MTLLIGYATLLELIYAKHPFPHSLDTTALLKLNLGLLFLHYFIASICFFFSCLFQDTKYSLGFGAGIPIFMNVYRCLRMLEERLRIRNTLLSLRSLMPMALSPIKHMLLSMSSLLFVGAIVFCIVGCFVFLRKAMYV